MLKELETQSSVTPPPRVERERPLRQAMPDRARGPAVATQVTGLAEVAGAIDRHLGQCRRHRGVFALVCVGVDVVDTESGLGFISEQTEKRVLQEVRNRICTRVRGGDAVLCPNERDACVLLPGASDVAARRIASRFQQALGGLYRIDELLLRVTVRVGSAAYPQDGMQSPELLRRATGW
ncbi:MAG TPA: hypothetical protein VF457_14880 [Burkholderiaceae bacterium]